MSLHHNPLNSTAQFITNILPCTVSSVTDNNNKKHKRMKYP